MQHVHFLWLSANFFSSISLKTALSLPVLTVSVTVACQVYSMEDKNIERSFFYVFYNWYTYYKVQ